MPRTCTACSHPRHDDVDRLLLSGTPLRNIAKRYSLSAATLFRHNKHISTVLANSRKEAEILRGDGLMEHLNHLIAEAERLKEKAEKAKDYRTALAGIREISRLVELLMRVAIDLKDRTGFNDDFGGRPLQQMSDVELLQIVARERGMTEARFLRIARGRSLPESIPPVPSVCTRDLD